MLHFCQSDRRIKFVHRSNKTKNMHPIVCVSDSVDVESIDSTKEFRVHKTPKSGASICAAYPKASKSKTL